MYQQGYQGSGPGTFGYQGQQQHQQQNPTGYPYNDAQDAPPPGYPGTQNKPYSSYQQAPPQQPFGFGPQGYNNAQAGHLALDVQQDAAAANFARVQVRNGFVRKVFGILSVQLLFTVGIACVCLYVKPVKHYVQNNPWIFYLAWGVSIGLLLVVMCVDKARRTYPLNMVLLMAFTLCEAFLVGMISSYYDIEVVILAFVTTCAAVFALTIFAINTKFDVTRFGSLFLVLLIVLIVLIFIGIFWVNRIYYLVIAGFGALLFSAYLIYDIQLLMGGRSYEISPDEYIFAALTIYIDIINLFLFILQIFGLARQS